MREPRRLTTTPQEEANPVFTADGQAILYTTNSGDRFAISKAERSDPKKFWWQNQAFTTTVLHALPDAPSRLKLSPDGKQLAYVRGRGDLCVLDLETKLNRVVNSSKIMP